MGTCSGLYQLNDKYGQVAEGCGIQKNTIEKRLLNSRGLPNFGINFYIVNTKGEYAGVSMYAARYAACTENGPQTLDCEPLLPARTAD